MVAIPSVGKDIFQKLEILKKKGSQMRKVETRQMRAMRNKSRREFFIKYIIAYVILLGK